MSFLLGRVRRTPNASHRLVHPASYGCGVLGSEDLSLTTTFQIDEVEETINKLTVDAPMVMRSVKTRTAARIMVERFREATEMLAENVRASF